MGTRDQHRQRRQRWSARTLLEVCCMQDELLLIPYPELCAHSVGIRVEQALIIGTLHDLRLSIGDLHDKENLGSVDLTYGGLWWLADAFQVFTDSVGLKENRRRTVRD